MPALIKSILLLLIINYGALIVQTADCTGSKNSVNLWDMWGVRELMCADQCVRQYFCEIKGQDGMRMIRIGNSSRHCWVS